jgi:uncharacterized protein (TIGR02996 family)
VASDREAELLEAVFADPEADAPRIVYMDFLQQQGDPRGELIALQLAGKDLQRQRELLALHAETWLGDAAQLIDRAPAAYDFERGFLGKARLIDAHGPLPREFATIVDLDAAISPESAGTLHTLRRMRVTMPDWVPASGVLGGWMTLFAARPRFQHVRLVHRDIVRFELRRYDGRCALAVNLEAYGTVSAAQWLRPIAELDGFGWRLELVSRWRRGHQDLADRITRLPNWEHVQIEGAL